MNAHSGGSWGACGVLICATASRCLCKTAGSVLESLGRVCLRSLACVSLGASRSLACVCPLLTSLHGACQAVDRAHCSATSGSLVWWQRGLVAAWPGGSVASSLLPSEVPAWHRGTLKRRKSPTVAKSLLSQVKGHGCQCQAGNQAEAGPAQGGRSLPRGHADPQQALTRFAC